MAFFFIYFVNGSLVPLYFYESKTTVAVQKIKTTSTKSTTTEKKGNNMIQDFFPTLVSLAYPFPRTWTYCPISPPTDFHLFWPSFECRLPSRTTRDGDSTETFSQNPSFTPHLHSVHWQTHKQAADSASLTTVECDVAIYCFSRAYSRPPYDLLTRSNSHLFLSGYLFKSFICWFNSTHVKRQSRFRVFGENKMAAPKNNC